MKFNFYPTIFLLISIIPVLIIRPQTDEVGVAKFVQSTDNVQERDTIKLFREEHGIETEYRYFKKYLRPSAEFFEDTLNILIKGSGYCLFLDLEGQNYTARFIYSNCGLAQKYSIRKQHLTLEDFNLTHNGILKGEYYCEAINPSFYNRQSYKYKIRGYFEMALVDREYLLRQREKQMGK